MLLPRYGVTRCGLVPCAATAEIALDSHESKPGSFTFYKVSPAIGVFMQPHQGTVAAGLMTRQTGTATSTEGAATSHDLRD